MQDTYLVSGTERQSSSQIDINASRDHHLCKASQSVVANGIASHMNQAAYATPRDRAVMVTDPCHNLGLQRGKRAALKERSKSEVTRRDYL